MDTKTVKEITVLITSLGGPVSTSILLALKSAQMNTRIVGTDCQPLSVGLFRVDMAYLVPDSGDKSAYLARMTEICDKEKVDIVFPGSERELRCLAEHRSEFERKTGSFVLTNNYPIIELATDKWLMAARFKELGIPHPASILPKASSELDDFIEQWGFPLLLKPRFSSGSKGVTIIHNRHQLDFFSNYLNDPVLQEYLENDEYTVGLFMEEGGRCLGNIIFRRVLAAGLTYKAQVVNDREISKVAIEAAGKLKIVGPCNAQLRKTESGPKIFEINPRISSSTMMRAHFGYNEPEMAIKKFILGETLSPPEIKNGIALRYWDEVYLENDEYLKLINDREITQPKSINGSCI